MCLHGTPFFALQALSGFLPPVSICSGVAYLHRRAYTASSSPEPACCLCSAYTAVVFPSKCSGVSHGAALDTFTGGRVVLWHFGCLAQCLMAFRVCYGNICCRFSVFSMLFLIFVPDSCRNKCLWIDSMIIS